MTKKIDTTNNNAPKYQTAYACEGKKLTIECDPGDLINLIRANYGRFSITICNDHGNVDWSVNCMFPKSLTVLNSRCAHKQSCSVLATTSMFGDPCPGTHKYLEAHYQCISASQTSTTTNRPSPPPWVLNNAPPPLLANGTTLISPAGAGAAGGTGSGVGVSPPRIPPPGNGIWNALPSSVGPPTMPATLPGGRGKGSHNVSSSSAKNGNRHDGLPPPPPLHHHHHAGGHHPTEPSKTDEDHASNNFNTTVAPNSRILTGVGGAGSDGGSSLFTAKPTQNRGGSQQQQTQSPVVSTLDPGGNFSGITRTINNINNAVTDDEDANMFCGPTNARNLFWNITRVGDVNVQPCPGGATGIAKWRCVLMKRITDADLDDDINSLEAMTTTTTTAKPIDCSTNGSRCESPTMMANKLKMRKRHFEPTWHPLTPDLTQCRSLWLNNLEVRVNQRDSSLISIANDLSEVTSSKTLYGGDMLVTTKIIQTMSEKMFHDKETFPDQRQREAIIMELLHGVVKTGSNLLDESQLSSWLDLNQEDQMRVATSLLTGLEYNAFLLADTIIRERNVVQKVKNILLSVRVLEAKNIQSNEVFPDGEQWQISDDRIELPRAALMENSEGGLVRIVFAAFDRLESILKPTYDHFDLKSQRSYVRNAVILGNDSDSGAVTAGSSQQQQPQQQRIRILNSKVISASLGKGRHIQLSQPIKLILRHLKTENVTNPTCVFWNYIDHAWSANGCSLESTNRTHSVCMCNHLTNFAILMDVLDEHNHSLFTMFDSNMRVLIYISIAICLIFIVVALLTLKIFNGVFVKSARTSIYRSIYICLLLVEILFLFGIEQSESSIFCGFTAVFLHCAILCAIAWFCFEAFQSYSTLTTDDMLLEVDQTAKVNCYYLLSYGLSLTVVAISLAINPRTYTKNDFCVLMDANGLFYATFVAPVLIFLLAAVVYTFLSWIILSRKSRSTLKNKEHTRLANVRFDIRCSFIFLLLLSMVWLSGYYYLRRAKADDDSAIVFGYLFVGFNTLMGLYIFVFHCIQNEKIRREYRKYVRQNSWLPKCLRCSKASISSGIVGNSGTGSGGGAIVAAPLAGGSSSGGSSSGSGSQMKKNNKLSAGDTNESEECPGEDAIMASSYDCELNEAHVRRTIGGSTSGGTLKSGILPGNLMLQHSKVNSSTVDSLQGHVVLERSAAGSNSGGLPAIGTIRSTGGGGGVHTPSAGHTSPTSSAGSTHLIFGHGHKQQIASAGINGPPPAPESFYHHPDYYAWKQQQQHQQGGVGAKIVGGGPTSTAAVAAHTRDYHGSSSSPQPAHEFFYWTQKHSHGHGKKKQRASGIGSESPSGSLHSRTTATSQQILFYPSYKKTSLKNQQPMHQYPHYSEAIDPSPYYQQQQQQPHHRRYPSAAQQQPPYLRHQLPPQHQQQPYSSDDEQMEPAAHAHLLHLNRREGGQQLPSPPPPAMIGHQYPPDERRYFRHRNPNCDLGEDYQDGMGVGVGVGIGLGGRGSDSYYNQDSLGGDGPVYEEILSNRNSDVQHYDVDGDGHDGDDDDDDNDDGGFRVGAQKNGGKVTKVLSSPSRNCRPTAAGYDEADDNDEDDDVGDEDDESVCDDDDDDDDDDYDEDDERGVGQMSAAHSLAQSDERMRRLMAMQDEDFKRRFQRQQRKNGPIEYESQKHQQQQQPSSSVFGASGGGSGSGSVSVARNIKKSSPSGRLAINELFHHGPPLPPANQHTKRQHQQQQQQMKLSPQSTTSPSSSSSSYLQQHKHSLKQQQQQQQLQPPSQQQQQQAQPQQPPIGRNISAMLDENNTVRCYLEPLSK